MQAQQFALEWTMHTTVFGQVRVGHGHDFYASEAEMHKQAKQLKSSPNVQRITYYQRKNGSLQAIEHWPVAH